MTEKEEKRLQRLNEKMAEMKAKQQAILAREKQRQRKDRTRRLVQNGILAEKYLSCEEMSPQKFEQFLIAFVKIEGLKNVIEQIKKATP